jgi:hypothetical protein
MKEGRIKVMLHPQELVWPTKTLDDRKRSKEDSILRNDMITAWKVEITSVKTHFC